MAIGSGNARRFGQHDLILELSKSPIGPLWLASKAEGDAATTIVMLRRVPLAPFRDAEQADAAQSAASWAAQLSDDRLSPIKAVVEQDGELGIAAEYVPGETLRSVLRLVGFKKKPISAPIACRVIADLLAALQAVHAAEGEARFRHGGVLPDGVLIGSDGHTRRLDPGISAIAARSTSIGHQADVAAYASPEQLDPDLLVDARSDVFSVGILLWEMLTGRRLFVGAAFEAVAEKVRKLEIQPLDNFKPAGGERIPQFAADLVARALHRDPAERFASAQEMRAAAEAAVIADPADVMHWLQELAGGALNARAKAAERAAARGSGAGGRVTAPPRASVATQLPRQIARPLSTSPHPPPAEVTPRPLGGRSATPAAPPVRSAPPAPPVRSGPPPPPVRSGPPPPPARSAPPPPPVRSALPPPPVRSAPPPPKRSSVPASAAPPPPRRSAPPPPHRSGPPPPPRPPTPLPPQVVEEELDDLELIAEPAEAALQPEPQVLSSATPVVDAHGNDAGNASDDGSAASDDGSAASDDGSTASDDGSAASDRSAASDDGSAASDDVVTSAPPLGEALASAADASAGTDVLAPHATPAAGVGATPSPVPEAGSSPAETAPLASEGTPLPAPAAPSPPADATPRPLATAGVAGSAGPPPLEAQVGSASTTADDVAATAPAGTAAATPLPADVAPAMPGPSELPPLAASAPGDLEGVLPNIAPAGGPVASLPRPAESSPDLLDRARGVAGPVVASIRPLTERLGRARLLAVASVAGLLMVGAAAAALLGRGSDPAPSAEAPAAEAEKAKAGPTPPTEPLPPVEPPPAAEPVAAQPAAAEQEPPETEEPAEAAESAKEAEPEAAEPTPAKPAPVSKPAAAKPAPRAAPVKRAPARRAPAKPAAPAAKPKPKFTPRGI